MSAFDEIDRTFNTTSIPTTGIFAPTTDQFFCELTKLDVRCLSSAQFVAQPFDQLCPSGDCWTDCQDLKRLYSPLPSGITFANQTAYGNPPNVTLWPLCASLTNISLSIAEEVAPAAEIAKVELFFKNTTLGNLRANLGDLFSRNSLLESISGFHAAQCYFSIPLAVAALITDPFSLDPLNAIGLLPVSINAKGTGLESSAFESLGDVASCGDLTAIGICLQFQQDSPPAFLIQKYGETAWIGIRLAPAVWAWCTILLLLLIILQRRSRMAGKALSKRSPKAWQGSYLVVPDRVRHILGGALAYYVLSGIFFVGLIYQAVMFYSYVSLGLVDLATWSFGQIVAITVWVPPVVDYLHLQLSETSADSQSLAETLIITIEVIMTKRRARGTRAGSPAASQELLATTGTSSWAATEQGYAPAAGHDDGAWQASPGIDAGPGDADTFGSAARPNEFPLEPREGRGS
ncbi:MAG: hypothetical protein M1832_003237 [Thelocarpon impressellum]|nr:MAG: hypothetical protein M1832_003237 [Thelocarpon impressellum]